MNIELSTVCTQWRLLKGTYDPDGFDKFEALVRKL